MRRMSSTLLYLFLSLPVFVFMVWHITSSLSPPPIAANLTNKRIILLIAHPDDESMFFSPTVQALAQPELGNHVKILCMSTGDSEGLGETRKLELEKAAVTLGLRKKEDVFVMNDKRFRDGMQEDWDEKEIARVLAQAFAPHLIQGSTSQHARTASGVDLDIKHKRTSSSASLKNGASRSSKSLTSSTAIATSSLTKDPRAGVTTQGDKPQASIDILLTFDASGISGHPNHKSLHHGARLFIQQVMKGYSGYNCPVALYTLTTTNILRKYSFILDLLPTYILNVFSQMFGGARQGSKTKQSRSDDRAIFVSDIFRYMTARKAMVQCHRSQMIWFRWGWISLGRYMVVNDLRREYVHA